MQVLNCWEVECCDLVGIDKHVGGHLLVIEISEKDKDKDKDKG